MKKEDIYVKALSKWGFELQAMVAIEEMSELTKELIKAIRAKRNDKNIQNEEQIAEEIADVEIMLEQIKLEFNNQIRVSRIKERKKYRLKKYLEPIESDNERTEITKGEFNSFHEVQQSGEYNMISEEAKIATGLSQEKYMEIINHYDTYFEIYMNEKR